MNDRLQDRVGSRIPDVTLERFHLGELPLDQALLTEALLKDDATLRHRLRMIEEDDAAARLSYPPEQMARDVLERLGPRVTAGDRPWLSGTWLVPATAFALVVLVTAWQAGWRPVGTPSPASVAPADDDERIKGAAGALVVYRNGDTGVHRLEEHEVVTSGDVVRVGYRVGDQAYGAIVSLDGRGLVTMHLPIEGSHAVALAPGGTIMLDRAFELDDAPRVERFFLVSGPEPFELAPVLAALRRTAADGIDAPSSLRLPPPLRFTVFSLRKG